MTAMDLCNEISWEIFIINLVDSVIDNCPDLRVVANLLGRRMGKPSGQPAQRLPTVIGENRS